MFTRVSLILLVRLPSATAEPMVGRGQAVHHIKRKDGPILFAQVRSCIAQNVVVDACATVVSRRLTHRSGKRVRSCAAVAKRARSVDRSGDGAAPARGVRGVRIPHRAFDADAMQMKSGRPTRMRIGLPDDGAAKRFLRDSPM
ncbi:hypothetical protein KDW49_14840 [Burkholderia dolosa]|nr:hypothetical protein [Burkholderia dolosa]